MPCERNYINIYTVTHGLRGLNYFLWLI